MNANRRIDSQIQETLIEQGKKADKLHCLVAGICIALLIALGVSYQSLSTAIVWSIGSAIPLGLAQLKQGSFISRSLITLSLVMLIAGQIQVSRGLLEFHFGFFVLLGFISYYKDVRIIILGAALIAVHHVTFAVLQTQGYDCYIYRGPFHLINKTFLHASFVVIEATIFSLICLSDSRINKESIRSKLVLSRLQGENGVIDLQEEEPENFLGQHFPTAHVVNNYRNRLGNIIHAFKNLENTITQMGEHALSLSHASAHISKDLISSQTDTIQLAQFMNELDQQSQHYQAFLTNLQLQMTNTSTAVTQAANDLKMVQSNCDESAKQIQSLSNSAQQVDQIASSMRAVAKETSLLSLNAAIEAARCGEQGRGFAVVADQVRLLADQSANDVIKVEKITKEIQSTVQTALDKSIQMQQANHQTQTAYNELSHTIQTLVSTTANQNQMAVNMFDLIKQSLQKCNTIEGSLNANSHQANTALSLSEITKTSAADMHDVLKMMQNQLSVFRVA